MHEMLSVPDISPLHLDSNSRIPYRIMKNERRLKALAPSTECEQGSTAPPQTMRRFLSDGGSLAARHELIQQAARYCLSEGKALASSMHPSKLQGLFTRTHVLCQRAARPPICQEAFPRTLVLSYYTSSDDLHSTTHQIRWRQRSGSTQHQLQQIGRHDADFC